MSGVAEYWLLLLSKFSKKEDSPEFLIKTSIDCIFLSSITVAAKNKINPDIAATTTRKAKRDNAELDLLFSFAATFGFSS